MKFYVCLFLSFFAFASCANQISKHSIYGKWQAGNSTKTILTFNNEKFLTAENLDKDGKVYFKESLPFTIIDDKKIRIHYYAQPEFKVSIDGQIRNTEELRIECNAQQSSDGRVMIDFPNICNFKEFVKIKE